MQEREEMQATLSQGGDGVMVHGCVHGVLVVVQGAPQLGGGGSTV